MCLKHSVHSLSSSHQERADTWPVREEKKCEPPQQDAMLIQPFLISFQIRSERDKTQKAREDGSEKEEAQEGRVGGW